MISEALQLPSGIGTRSCKVSPLRKISFLLLTASKLDVMLGNLVWLIMGK